MRRIFLNASSPAVIAFLLVLLSICTAQAQSGRRLPKGSPSTAPEAPAEAEKPSTERKTPTEPQLHLLLISDTSMSLNFSMSFAERVQQWVAQRLRESAALEVAVGDRGSRGDAVKRAKASTEGFVIFLQVEESNLGTDVTRTSNNLNDIRISYSVLSPVTGKSKSSGIVYANQRSTIGIGQGRTLPLCYPGVRGNEYILLQASLEVAERIMSVLSVPVPPLCS